MAAVRVYTTQYCPYCSWVKKLLQEKNIPFEEVDVSGRDDLRSEIAQKSGMQTVPQVFINDVSIGGYDRVRALSDSGELDKIVAEKQ